MPPTPTNRRALAPVTAAPGRGSELQSVLALLTAVRPRRAGRPTRLALVVRAPRGFGRTMVLDAVASALTAQHPTHWFHRVDAGSPGWLDDARRALAAPAVASARTLLVDDAHRAGETERTALLDLLVADVPDAERGLAPAAEPCSIVLAGAAGEPAAVAEGLVQEGWDVRVLDLDPLDQGGVALRLGRERPDREVEELHAGCGGNPAVLAAMRSGAAVDPAGNDGGSALRELAAAWYGELPADEGEVAWAAAVVGPRFDLEVVAVVAGRPLADVAAATDRLVARGLLASRPEAPRFAHRYPALLPHVIACRPAQARQEAHARADAALAGRGASAGRRARHLVGRSAGPDPEAIGLLLAAAGRRDAWRGEVLDALLDLLPAGDPNRSEVLAAQAGHRAGSGDLAGWRQTMHARLDADGAATGGVIAELVEVELLVDPVPAIQLLDRLLGLLPPDGDSGDGALGRAVTASAATYAGAPFDRARTRAEAAEAGLAADSSPVAGVTVAGAVAWAAALGGDPDVDACVDRALERFDALTDADLARSILGAHQVAQAALTAQRLLAAEAVARRIRSVAATSGQAHLLPFLDVTLARCELFQGALDAAGCRLAESVAHLRLGDGRLHLAFGLATLAYVDAMQGDHDAARRAVAETLALLLAEPPSLLRTGSLLFVAHTLATVGAAGRAADALLEAGGGPRLQLLPAVDRAYGYEILAVAAIEAGELDLAHQWVELAGAASAGPMALAAAARAAAAVAAAEGDHRSAGVAARRARAASDSAGGRLEAARARLLEGLAHSAGGERDPAVIELLWVHRTCAELGAATFGAVASRQLRRLGRRAPVAVDRRALSDREAEVGALVASGLTNREIARALFISERTVESHVANVLAKVGVRTRVGLAAVLTPFGPEEEADTAVVVDLPRLVPAPVGPAAALLATAEQARRLGEGATSGDGETTVVRARLLAASSPAGDGDAVTAVAEAARWEEAAGRLDAAADRWAAAGALLAEGEVEEQAAMWVGWCRCLERAGRIEEAHDVALRLVAATEAGEALVRAEALDRLERIRHHLGHDLGADEPWRQEGDGLPDRVASLRQRIALRRALLDADPVAAPPELLPGVLLDPTSRCLHALVSLRVAGDQPIDVAGGLDVAAAELLGDATAHDLDGERAEALVLLAWWAHLSGRMDLAAAVGATLTGGLDGRGRPGPWALAGAMVHVVSLLCGGRIADAADPVETLLRAARTADEALPRLVALGGACMAAAVVDDLSRASVLADELVLLAGTLPPSPWRAWALGHAAIGQLLGGRPALAVDTLVDGGRDLDLTLALHPDRGRYFELLVRADVARDDLTGAAARADRADATCGGPGTSGSRRRRAIIALAAGDVNLVEELLVDVPGDDRLPVLDQLMGRRLVASARALASGAAGSSDDLADVGQQARRMGAEHEWGQAARGLRTMGLRPRRAPVADRRVPGLTARQTQVAELVAAGRSNRQIAEALSVSEKTVEGHVSSVLQRLQVRSRVGIGAVLRSLGAPGGPTGS